jgi:hypothetical protein
LGAATKAGADWLNIKAATHIGTPDLNLARQKERFGTALKAGKRRDLEDMEEKAGRRLVQGGLVGATGVLSGAAGGYDAYTKGFLGLKGWGKQIFGGLKNRSFSTKGIVVENRDKQRERLELADGVMSEDDYESRHATLDTDGLKYNDDFLAAQKRQSQAAEEFEAVKDTPDSDAYKKAEKKKQEADDDLAAKEILVTRNKDAVDKLEEAKSHAQSTKDEKGRKLWIDTGDKQEQENAVRDRRREYQKEAGAYAKKAAGYTLMDFEGLAAMRAADHEAGKGITSRDEAELAANFDVAVTQDDAPLARVLMEKLAGVNGTNFLFAQHGYQAKRGYNEDEYAAIQKRIKGPDKEDSEKAREEYENNKGTHDFIRDIFVDKLHMDKQRAFAFQNDVASIGEEKGADHLKKTIRVDSAGNYNQVTEKEHAENNQIENLKRDAETVFRRNNRLDFGAENAITKAFEFSASGLSYAMSNLGIIFKEMNSGRLNKSTAKAFSEQGAQIQLRDMMKRLGINKIKNGKDEISAEDFLTGLRGFAAASTNDTVGKVLKIMHTPGAQAAAPAGGAAPTPPPGGTASKP